MWAPPSAPRRAAPRQPSGVGYWLGRNLYLGLTNECNARTLVELRGPGFCMPAASGFAPLPRGYEPAAAELLAFAEEEAGCGPPPDAVVFAGVGEPLLRLETLTEASRLL
eukprot:2525303-Prymnesium_polylepis.1